MALFQTEQKGPDSSSMALDLPSNNPFRLRAASPIQPGQAVTMNASAPAPSRNPFLDASNTTNIPQPFPPTTAHTNGDAWTGSATDVFNNLSLNENLARKAEGRPVPPTRSYTDKALPGAPRPENAHPRHPSHRPSQSQEDSARPRRVGHGPTKSRTKDELDVFADPAESPKRSTERRLRRNSDTSVQDRVKLTDSEEDRRRQERRRRERKYRDREAGKESKTEGKADSKADPKARRPGDRKLDVIDQLDATSIYGTGLFHHDGPFDACNPHRNRAGSRRAPMQAFPKDSLNNAIGGGGPVNQRPNHATFLGNNDEEAFKDYAKGSVNTTVYEPYDNGAVRPVKQEPLVTNFMQKVEPVHGDESMGLGTSTFLDGAPASRMAIQRRESETVTSEPAAGGIQRKKSLAQKIRGINNPRREYGAGRVRSPEGINAGLSPDATYTPGGTQTKNNESNPFFNEFEPSSDKKQETITIAQPANRPQRARAPSSPSYGFNGRLERRVTSDGSGNSDEAKPMGFLSRVRSLKGGRKPREQQKPLV